MENTLELEMQAEGLAESTHGIQVTSATYQEACEMVLAIDRLRKRIEDYWKAPKASAHKAWKEILAKENEMLEPLDAERKNLKGKIETFLTEEDAKRRAEQARIDREQAERVAAERALLESKIEKAEEAGDELKAAMLEEKLADIDVTPEIIPSSIEKTTATGSGSVTSRADIEVSVTDLRALAREIAEGRAPISLIEPKSGAIKTWVKLEQLKVFPGLVIREVRKPSFRGAA